MRNVKYRVWDKEYKVFDNCPSPDILLGNDGAIYEKQSYTFAMQTYDEYVETDKYEVSLFTGLHDKHGVPIYEGDIILDSFGNRNGVIRYNKYTASFDIDDYDGIHLLSAHNSERFFEVIGNVYQNPDLLGDTP